MTQPGLKNLKMPSSRRSSRICFPCFCCGTTLLTIDDRFSCDCRNTTICVKMEDRGCGKCLHHCECVARAARKTAKAKAEAKKAKQAQKDRQPVLFEIARKVKK